MTPGALWLLVGSVALWTGLPAAPSLRRTSGQPPLPPSGVPGEAPQDKIWQKEEAGLVYMVAQGKEGGEDRKMGAGQEGILPLQAAGLSKGNPQTERKPANNPEAESSGAPRSVEEPQGASEKVAWAELGGAPVSPGGEEKPSSLGRPALPNLETWDPVWDPSHVATTAGKTNASGGPTSSSPGGKPRPPTPGKATPTEEPVPGPGKTTRDKPKPALPAGHQVGPASGEEPAAKSGPEAPGRPVAGEKPPTGEKLPSQAGQEKGPSADKPASSEKPGDGGEPEAEKEEPSPEKETEAGKKMEEEEEGLFDDDDDEGEEGEKGQEDEGGPPGGNPDADDAFDKELDYGLNKGPFDADSFHDAWSDEGDEGAELGLMGEMAAPPQAGDADGDGKPTFDVWGDLVGGSGP